MDCSSVHVISRESYAGKYQTEFRRTVRLLVSRGAPYDIACDAAQSAWAKGWEQRQSLRNEGFLISWVNTIALNFYRRVLRRAQRFEKLAQDPMTNGMDTVAMDLERILARCGPRERQLLEESKELSIGQLATAYGVSNTAMRIRLLRARRSARAAAFQESPS
jgi:DNA-directed RNA polymerase specialized sigma24 family protein